MIYYSKIYGDKRNQGQVLQMDCFFHFFLQMDCMCNICSTAIRFLVHHIRSFEVQLLQTHESIMRLTFKKKRNSHLLLFDIQENPLKKDRTSQENTGQSGYPTPRHPKSPFRFRYTGRPPPRPSPRRCGSAFITTPAARLAIAAPAVASCPAAADRRAWRWRGRGAPPPPPRHLPPRITS